MTPKYFLPRLLLVAAIAGPLALGANAASAADPSLAIDAGTAGNTATTIGTIENCISVNKDDQFQVDVLIQNVTNLLAWEVDLEYDPAVLLVVDQDVKAFQQANVGSAVIDLSARTPDSSGLHPIAAFDSSDPITPDSGSGILARVTLKAVGNGDSVVGFAAKDLNGDGHIEQGTLLRDTNANLIDDKDGDTWFDGVRTNAHVAVNQDCAPGSIVAPSPHSSGGDSSFTWAIAAGGGAAGAIVVLGATAILFSRRRSARRRTVDDAS